MICIRTYVILVLIIWFQCAFVLIGLSVSIFNPDSLHIESGLSVWFGHTLKRSSLNLLESSLPTSLPLDGPFLPLCYPPLHFPPLLIPSPSPLPFSFTPPPHSPSAQWNGVVYERVIVRHTPPLGIPAAETSPAQAPPPPPLSLSPPSSPLTLSSV